MTVTVTNSVKILSDIMANSRVDKLYVHFLSVAHYTFHSLRLDGIDNTRKFAFEEVKKDARSKI